MKILLIIGTGSFLGGILRFLASRFIQGTLLSAFPFGTFVVNITGCFLIGLFYGLSERGALLSPEWRMFLTVGFCGGFTTFSTFANENYTMLSDSNFLHVALYVSLSVFVGICATYFGNLVTKLI
jgi:fluoride exporter